MTMVLEDEIQRFGIIGVEIEKKDLDLYLKGEVSSYYHKQMAQEIARRHGRVVHNNIKVKVKPHG